MTKVMSKEYENFYSGKNRRAMHHAFSQLIDSLRTDNFDCLEKICTVNCIADFSTAGRMIGIDAMKTGLQWPGPKMHVSKATIWNFVARSMDGKGQQSAYIQCIRSLDNGVNVYPFLYGGQFSNTFVYEDGQWKFSHIRFDLCYEYGNNIYVKDKWTLMDDTRFCGHQPMINAELDNPWLAIPEDCELQSDEEQIFELMFKYAFAFDNGDFRFLRSFVTDDFFINGSKNRKDYKDSPLEPGDFLGHRMVSDFLKDKFHKEAKMIHACRMKEIDITGNTAIAYMPRGEEHRLKNRVLDRYNIHSIFTTAIHFIYAIKDENGEWKMWKYRIEPQSEMIPVEDDCIAYDEYVISGGDHEKD